MHRNGWAAWVVAAVMVSAMSAFSQDDAPAPRARTRRAAPQREGMTEAQREELRQQRAERMRQREALSEEERATLERRRRERRLQWEALSEDERREMRERMQQRREQERQTREVRPQPAPPRPERPQPGRRPGAGDQADVEQGALREAMREALQQRRRWVLERYDRDGDGMLSENERTALRRDLQEHMQKFFR